MAVVLEQEKRMTTTDLVEKLIAQAKRFAKPKDEDEDFDDGDETPKKGKGAAGDEEDDEGVE
ncbi:MAG: hypothetical protein JWP27_927 [Flaviaesturariibacter sp.]|nr:hypothetical protein [Flaviaesturariibacter sp.]